MWGIESFEKACKFIGSSRVAARMFDEGVIAFPDDMIPLKFDLRMVLGQMEECDKTLDE